MSSSSTSAAAAATSGGTVFDKDEASNSIEFPTEPAFLFKVEVKSMSTEIYGEGHYGVFALEEIPSDTKFWVWTDRVKSIHYTKLEVYLQEEATKLLQQQQEQQQQQKEDTTTTTTTSTKTTKEDYIRLILRQGFVLPNNDKEENSKKDENFNTNPTDAGRFMNHSNTPNCGVNGTLRKICIGEEMTMDYSFHGNPQWYQDICHKYDVLTERDVAMKYGSK